MKTEKKKGSFTVEAALICPFVCLVICAMMVVTLSFYHKVVCFGEEMVQSLKETDNTSMVLRMERILIE